MEDEDVPDTRVFVSGLPPNFTSNQLGAHFAGRYQITDATVVPDRRIGFVGFRNYTLAKSAIKYFDKSYIRMSKISVEMAKPVEIQRTSTPYGIPKTKQSKQDTTHQSSIPGSGATNGYTSSITKSNTSLAFQPYVPLKSNKRKRELQVDLQEGPSKPRDVTAAAGTVSEQQDRDLNKAKRRAKGERKEHKAGVEEAKGVGIHEEDKSTASETKRRRKKEIANDPHSKSVDDNDPMAGHSAEGLEIREGEGKKRRKKKNVASSTALNDQSRHVEDAGGTEHVAARNQSQTRQMAGHGTKGGVERIDDDTSQSSKSSADQNKQQPPKSTVTSDNDWMRAKISRLLDLMDKPEQDSGSIVPETKDRGSETTTGQGVENVERLGGSAENLTTTTSLPNSIPSNGRLFVRNLPYTANVAEIEGLFSKYGRLDEVHLIRDKAGNSSGMAYVHFAFTDHAERALQELDGKSFQGRLLHILRAAERKSHKLDDYEISKLPLKKQKALKRRIQAGVSTFNWNSMYMNPDAVLSSVADRLGVAKSDLINASSSDAAVKQAHAETHVIQETKAFLASSGVKLDAFKQRERDDRTLLVKNFPFGTTVEELKTLFVPYGEIVKLLLPPSGTIAIIQYAQPGEGIQAMRNLAYRNLNGSVLYLEKAPKNLFNTNGQSILDRQLPGKAPTTQEDGDPGKGEQSSSSTLFVRNLNFATTTAGLIDAFKPLNGFLSARVKTKIEPRRPQELLSMGFGFVEFRSNQQARAALAVMNGRRLDNHEILVQISHKATDMAEEQRYKDDSKKAEARKSKLIIKNLPFEATKKDVRALLSAYGQLRSVKVPKKFDHSTRGFAFADFVTPKEAENTMEALKDTHLLGRRLVIEYAEEESVDPEDEIRAIESKVGRQTEMIHLNKITGSTRTKFNIESQDDV